MPDAAASPSRSKPVLWLIVAIAGGTFLFAMVTLFRPLGISGTTALLVYCAASLKPALEKLAAEYSRETGVLIELSYGGSQTLLANIEITKRGDIYVPADESYNAIASEKGLINETLPLAQQSAVVAVSRGNPKRIHSLRALEAAPLTLSQANPETAAIGKLLRAGISPSLWQALSNRTLVFKPNVSDAANDVTLGAVDAAIVWDSMRQQYPDLEFVFAPELDRVKAKVAASVLSCSQQPEAARKFVRYLASPRGLEHFARSGFTTVTNHL